MLHAQRGRASCVALPCETRCSPTDLQAEIVIYLGLCSFIADGYYKARSGLPLPSSYVDSHRTDVAARRRSSCGPSWRTSGCRRGRRTAGTCGGSAPATRAEPCWCRISIEAPGPWRTPPSDARCVRATRCSVLLISRLELLFGINLRSSSHHRTQMSLARVEAEPPPCSGRTMPPAAGPRASEHLAGGGE